MTTDTSTLPRERNASAARNLRSAKAAPARRADRWVAPAKVAVFVAAWYPLVRLLVLGLTGGLGADPIRFITWSTGLWTLVFLCITLAVTPVRKMTGFTALLRFRRMLGLYAFFYACLHFVTYLWFDKWFDIAEIVKDIGKRPFITVGFAAFVLLIVLAATSPRAAARKLGRRWQTLHRAVYAIAALAILHFWWLKAGKHDLQLPKIYGAIVVALLGWRLAVWLLAKARERRQRA
ncbi:protein-methionine-sulfoxide reductase heme-binding subunit MsrQ [Trinickia caryophylli]|uniref:Protein-methionine-sulfoxide reductase heme-binding subunit MsrQ n=1 Tax=Trinickia caryophylli TaxID=28094 RepID=A0A1X7F510_TRICW|nr:protein-methionine-sulfoxide reductase heme-binding subunit MsrQ [Trinickia caryophylli]PMS09233.1 protein-methionine-sulfoxide reductase heme-binding subunit MsrQ [Trinickia caryophylli]TRX19408.1 protein-methionine-sulfoxide reductase heme-binding subunit MsrQ [Trinickia caryophylli]WQE13285.1 protein-methionine-sulfoxide reductase heme-binding subunit MsrQ [Trinickia caryophylli]SMF46117.1 sulfoxide reductase heme-binding subunit YedZ [Trinickia caryophylli]GLU34395.1 protein-methionine-